MGPSPRHLGQLPRKISSTCRSIHVWRDFLGNAEDIRIGEASFTAEEPGAGAHTAHNYRRAAIAAFCHRVMAPYPEAAASECRVRISATPATRSTGQDTFFEQFASQPFDRGPAWSDVNNSETVE